MRWSLLFSSVWRRRARRYSACSFCPQFVVLSFTNAFILIPRCAWAFISIRSSHLFVFANDFQSARNKAPEGAASPTPTPFASTGQVSCVSVLFTAHFKSPSLLHAGDCDLDANSSQTINHLIDYSEAHSRCFCRPISHFT